MQYIFVIVRDRERGSQFEKIRLITIWLSKVYPPPPRSFGIMELELDYHQNP
jgi:hypothetical protein